MQGSEVSFSSAGGTCNGVLYRPDGDRPTPTPVVVIAHGFSGTRLTQYDRRARRLVAAGVAVLDFDPRYVGTSPGTPRQRIDAMAWLDDLRAAIAHVRSLPDIDGERVGIYGSSLGGGLAFAVAADDARIGAIALDVPALDGLRATPAPMSARPALAVAMARDLAARRRGRPPVVLPVFGEIGSGAVLQYDTDGFWQAMDELEGIEWVQPRRVARHPETGEWRNEATALELISLVRFRPGRKAAMVRCPVLAHLSEDDHVVPFGATRKLLAKAPQSEVRTLRGGHFAPFHGDGFETTTAAQVEFFGRHLVGA